MGCSMARVFIKKNIEIGDTFILNTEEAHHLVNVLRYKEGQEFTTVSGERREFVCELTLITKGEVRAVTQRESFIQREPKAQITLFQGLPKGDKMEFIIQKGTEIGAVGFVPVEMSHSIARVKPSKVERWLERLRKIALSAAKQSMRQVIPLVHEPVSFAGMVERLAGFDAVVVPYECQRQGSLQQVAQMEGDHVAIVIGPEGGFAEHEIDRLKALGAALVSLGPRILRTETAGMVTLALLLFARQDMEA